MADAYDYDAQEKYCKIYDRNDFFTTVVQIALAFCCLGALWYKRLTETPMRTFWTWFMDVFKQGAGACYAHVLNMIIAAVLSENMREGINTLKDQCAWYGLSFLIDTTLGLFLAILCLRALDELANDYNWTHLKDSGVYVGPDGWKHWISQLIAWLAIMTVTKIIIYFFMWAFSQELAWIGQLLFAPLQGNIRFELIFVMILFPGVLNVIYFWIADSYLKAKDGHVGVHEPTTLEDPTNDRKESLLEGEIEATKPPSVTRPSWATPDGNKTSETIV
uniref:Transmembrane protein 110 n=1 Tax=Amphora coffeiformis TaxID=265554 RepID=A0A7S3LBX4_9STRA|mmetsp:Transcript_15272/g.29003  ORF Transcript_15272/g.29003 Transcript_15272/m.29003 type:complete len:276 (+) Transcript_15272:164-991(+)